MSTFSGEDYVLKTLRYDSIDDSIVSDIIALDPSDYHDIFDTFYGQRRHSFLKALRLGVLFSYDSQDETLANLHFLTMFGMDFPELIRDKLVKKKTRDKLEVEVLKQFFYKHYGYKVEIKKTKSARDIDKVYKILLRWKDQLIKRGYKGNPKWINPEMFKPDLSMFPGSFSVPKEYMTGVKEEASTKKVAASAIKSNGFTLQAALATAALSIFGLAAPANAKLADNKGGIEQYEKAAELNPADAYAHDELGFAYSKSDKYLKAIKSYKKVIELDPKFRNAHYNLGTVYEKIGKYSEAFPNFKKAIELDPTDAVSYQSLGSIYCRKGKYSEAIENLKKAIELDASFYEAYYNLGVAYLLSKEYQQAIENLKKTIELDPKFVSAYYQLGNVYREMKNYLEAIESYKTCFKVNPEVDNSEMAYLNLGVTYYLAGQYQQAIKNYKKVIELDPKFSNVHYNLGTAYSKLGRYREAIQSLKKAAEIDPKFKGETEKIILRIKLLLKQKSLPKANKKNSQNKNINKRIQSIKVQFSPVKQLPRNKLPRKHRISSSAIERYGGIDLDTKILPLSRPLLRVFKI